MEQLKRVLLQIEENEIDYDKRYGLVISAMHYAGVLGYPNYIRFDPEAPGWPVFCIELPGAGEVSWHMPSTQKEYTGYTTEIKYTRIHEWVAASESKNEKKRECDCCHADLTLKARLQFNSCTTEKGFCGDCFTDINLTFARYSKVIKEFPLQLYKKS